jgi:hypothetical protein
MLLFLCELTPRPCDPLGPRQDFGARDATAGELASNFGENTLGNWDTSHIVK